MTDFRDRFLHAAAVGFACATGYNSVVAIRETAPGEPLGLRIPLSVSTATLVGWGSAVAAPWPMPVVALVAARHSGRDGATGPALVCAGLGVAGIVGILMEPNTYNVRSWPPAIRRAVLAHVATCSMLAGAGIWCRKRRARSRP